MQINHYSSHGRTLLVKFTCNRCKKTETRPLKDCMTEIAESGFRDLHDLRPPEGWENGGFYYPMFCPRCKKAYERFMNGEELINETD